MKLWLLILLAIMVAACDESGSDDINDNEPIASIFVREPTHDGSGTVRTYASSIRFEGDGFISPANVDCKTVFPVNLTLKWSNNSTGKSGDGISGSRCASTFLGTFANSKWAIREGTIELAFGINRIVITVSDNKGNSSSVTVIVERLVDDTPPYIVSHRPAPDEIDFPINRNISVRFSEDMLQSSLTRSNFVLTDPLDLEVNGRLTYDARNFIWTLDPNTDLFFSTTYTLTIGGSVEDRFGGNSLGEDVTWKFTTAPNPDVTPPTVIRVSPEPGTQCIPPDATVVVEFDEPMDSTTINAANFLLEDADSNIVSAEVDYDNVTARLVPDLPLLTGTRYDALLTTDIKDLAGNSLETVFGWSFHTDMRNPSGIWTQTSMVNAPTERYSHTSIWTGSEMIVFGGGEGEFSITNTGGRYNPVSNSWTATSRENALSFREHTAVWTGSEMIVWGGGDDSGARYEPDTDTWQHTSRVDAPSFRSKHAAIWTGSEMIVWGGSSHSNHVLNTGARYNPTTDTWRPMSLEGAPSPRIEMAVVWTGSEFVVWGGRSGSIVRTDGARYDPVSDSWTPMATVEFTSWTSQAYWTGNEILFWDGGIFRYTGSDGIPLQKSTLKFYDPATDTWRETANTCEPYLGGNGFYGHWTGSRLFAWSKNSDRGGYFYEPSTDSWSPISTSATPPSRSDSASVWAGDRFILWGGQQINGLQNSGFMFVE